MNGILQSILTTLRGRKILGGSFVTATASVPTSQRGDGVAAYSTTGTFTVTLAKYPSLVESLVCTIDNAADDDKIVAQASFSSGVITIIVRDISGAGAANTTGMKINWIMIGSDRTS